MLFFFYGIVPLFVPIFSDGEDSGFSSLGLLGCIAAFSFLVGASICEYTSRNRHSNLSLEFPQGQGAQSEPKKQVFIATVFLLFFAVQAILISTASEVPLISAIRGEDAERLAVEREQFLKTRTGWQAPLVYANAMLAGSIVPFALAMAFVRNLQARWMLFLIFIVSCTSFLEKAFFFKALFPILVVFSTRKNAGSSKFNRLILAGTAILLTVTLLVYPRDSASQQEGQGIEQYFSPQYLPSGPVDHLVWRSIGVPVFTAADSLLVFHSNYEGKNFNGSTSGLVSYLSGIEKVEFEREVFSSQWGQNITGTGSANSVYFVESFVNFGYIGVVVSSLFSGFMMRWMTSGLNPSLAALWPIFAFGLFTGGMAGLLLSNGFVIVFSLAAFGIGRLKKINKEEM